MRPTKIIWHCFGTRIDQNFGIEDVTKWHLARGFSECGYHYIIRLDGTIEKGRDDSKQGAHCKENGGNRNSLGISFEGGFNANGRAWDMPTSNQIDSAIALNCQLEMKYKKQFKHYGHYEFSRHKTCPNFPIEKLKELF